MCKKCKMFNAKLSTNKRTFTWIIIIVLVTAVLLLSLLKMLSCLAIPSLVYLLFSVLFFCLDKITQKYLSQKCSLIHICLYVLVPALLANIVSYLSLVHNGNPFLNIIQHRLQQCIIPKRVGEATLNSRYF